MKIFPILFLFIFVSCNGQETKCNNDFNLKGRVKNVEEITKYNEYEIKSIYSLNEDDFILTIQDYNMNNLIEKKEFIYENKIIKEINVINSKGKVTSKSKYIKNKKNQIEKTITNSSNGKSVIKHNYEGSSEFPKSGNEIDADGKIIRSWKLEYKDNLVSVQSNCNPDGTIISETTFSHNDNNDLVEVIERDKNGEIINKQYSEYQYDDKKNWIERKLYDRNRNLISTSIRKINYW